MLMQGEEAFRLLYAALLILYTEEELDVSYFLKTQCVIR